MEETSSFSLQKHMRILILEDSDQKWRALIECISSAYSGADFVRATNFIDYIRELTRARFDFVVLDLLIPRFAGAQAEDLTLEILEATRGDYKCPNFRTPGIVLTEFDQKAEEQFREINRFDINVVTYSEGSTVWRDALIRRISNNPARDKASYVILCALEKEVLGFRDAGCVLGAQKAVLGLTCWPINIDGRLGMVVLAPRMGLVDAAIAAALSIQTFEPEVVCMSGICAGVGGATKIYDVVVSETCHQHDAGKWTDGALEPEIYSISMPHRFAQDVRRVIGSIDWQTSLTRGISPAASEYPMGVETISPRVLLGATASGSAVIADGGKVGAIAEHQRKLASIEMEAYAVYEACRVSPIEPSYFCAKAVVDNGGADKGDRFHRIGCILSARVVAEIVKGVVPQRSSE